MNRHSKNDTIRMDIIKAHIDDLIAQGLIRYRFFLILNEHQISTDVRNTIRNTFIEILQFTSQQQLCNDKHLLRNAEGLLKLEEDDIGLLFRIWADCFKAADSSRKTMKLLCSEFLTLIQNLPKELHGKPLQPIPQFFRQHGHAAFKLIPTVVHNVGNTSTYEDSVKCLNLIEQYISAVSLKTLAAFSSLITIICQKCGNQYLDKLVQACPPKVFGHDHHCESFIMNCAESIKGIPSEFIPKYLELCLAVARQSYGSASYVAYIVPKKLLVLETNIHEAYIDSFSDIVNSVGICSVGFCSSRLPRLFKSTEEATVLESVEAICQIATQYGPDAARAFIERKTQTSRRCNNI